MKSRVGIITSNDLIFNKLRLILRADAAVERVTEDCYPGEYDLVFADADAVVPEGVNAVTVGEGSSVPFPFKHEDVLGAFCNAKSICPSPLTLSANGKHAFLNGEVIKLSSGEYRLLERLLEGGDDFIPVEDLLRDVWGNQCDEGSVIVYVHYLRRKLEKHGEKIILSTRVGGCGYKIDDKYRGQR